MITDALRSLSGEIERSDDRGLAGYIFGGTLLNVRAFAGCMSLLAPEATSNNRAGENGRGGLPDVVFPT